MMWCYHQIMMQRLRQALSQWQKRRIVQPDRVPSAVLVPIYNKHGEWHILFIKRTEKVKVHKGQISFPGGTHEEQDAKLLNTALREGAEEIGLAPGDVEILGALDDTLTITSNYVISPFIALIPWPYQFKIDSDEVDEIIEVPISALLDRACISQNAEIIDGKAVTTYTYHYQGRVIWGATARILNQFLGIWAQVMGASKANKRMGRESGLS